MGRQATGWFNRRIDRWVCRAGPISAKTGKATRVVLKDELGRPIAEHDIAGRDAAIARLLAARTVKDIQEPDEVAAQLRRIVAVLSEMLALRGQEVRAVQTEAEDRGGPGRLLTVDDLAIRWKCEPATVMQMIRSRKIPYVQVGNKKPLDQRGPKDLRFRLAAISAWEADAEMVWMTPESMAEDERKRAATVAGLGLDTTDNFSRGSDDAPRRPRPGPRARRTS